jgi:hypothetical protein
MTTVFHRVGHYEIHDRIGRGGMAEVFLATDTRTNNRVALKLVSIETDREGQQVLEAERWGAKLQEELCRESRYVPLVYEHGTHGQHFYIAMEHLGGRNLSDVIAEGPLPAPRAVRVAIQLCEFLQCAEAFDRTLDGRQFNLLLHGDLKPRNIRVLEGDEIKVFDFGIAKALSLSRKVTRNDFGSIAYLSPERLESGEIDAQAEFWAVGILLYEMVSGAQPFRAADTRRLEQRIRAREAPPALDGACPIGLQAIIGKLLASRVTDRYANAGAIRADLQRFASGDDPLARLEGWPARGYDEAATRRTHRPVVADEEVTRRTARNHEAPATSAAVVPAASAGGAAAAVAVASPAGAVIPVSKPPAAVPVPAPAARPAATAPARMPIGARFRRIVRRALLAIAFFVVVNEIRVYVVSSALAENAPQDLGGVMQMWGQHAALSDGSLGLGSAPLERALTRQSIVLAERTFDRYRTAGATVFEREWKQTRDALAVAQVARPGSRQIHSALKYCEGHLRRIDGEARIRAKESAAAQLEFTAAVIAFREAAEARQKWPDPFLGLMRTFVALDDIERGADALAQAERYGYSAGPREWALLGEGYFSRAAKLADSEELEPLTRAAEAYGKAIEHLSKAVGFGNAGRRTRDAQRRLEQVQVRIEALSEKALEDGVVAPPVVDRGPGA